MKFWYIVKCSDVVEPRKMMNTNAFVPCKCSATKVYTDHESSAWERHACRLSFGTEEDDFAADLESMWVH